jgi:hypothetical protein
VELTGLVWAGTRTDRFDDMVSFLGEVMGLESTGSDKGFAAFRLPNGDKFEVFGPEDSEHDFFTRGPVVGFGVPDVDRARAELEGAGIEFIGPVHRESGFVWSHFHGPDGNVYELTES